MKVLTTLLPVLLSPSKVVKVLHDEICHGDQYGAPEYRSSEVLVNDDKRRKVVLYVSHDIPPDEYVYISSTPHNMWKRMQNELKEIARRSKEG